MPQKLTYGSGSLVSRMEEYISKDTLCFFQLHMIELSNVQFSMVGPATSCENLKDPQVNPSNSLEIYSICIS